MGQYPNQISKLIFFHYTRIYFQYKGHTENCLGSLELFRNFFSNSLYFTIFHNEIIKSLGGGGSVMNEQSKLDLNKIFI